MNHSLEHLPERKRRHLDIIVKIIRAAVDAEMIVLYGSHARGDWVEDARGRKFSDYDILVIVDSEAKVDDVDLWWRLRERLDRRIHPNEVQLIVHDIEDVNRQLENGWYFFVDVEREGVMLHDSGRHVLAEPRPKTRAERRVFAQQCFREYMENADDFYSVALTLIEKGRNKVAAFQLHQAAEHYYKCALLVVTAYWPKEHNIKYLAKLGARRSAAWSCSRRRT
jgi:predicted nucleotidyltransferase